MPAAPAPTPGPSGALPGPPSDPPALSRVAAAHRIDAATLDAVIERLAVGVLVLDADGRVAYANAEARAIRATEIAPVRWAATRALLTEVHVREEEIELRAADGTRRWLGVDATPARAPGAAPHAVVLTVVDVTARARAAQWRPMLESLMNL